MVFLICCSVFVVFCGVDFCGMVMSVIVLLVLMVGKNLNLI